MEDNKILVKKKRKGLIEEFNPEKIHVAIRKSADRILVSLNDDECKKVSDLVLSRIEGPEITVRKLHNIVEVCLDDAGFPRVAESYRRYREYKTDAQKILEAVDKKTLELSYREDRSNANAESTLVSTKRSILFGEQQKEIYKRMYLDPEEYEANEKLYIYIHDVKDRLSTFNCDLVNFGRILKGGFTLANIDYTEPKSLAAAMSVTADLISAIASNMYGGLTAPQIDEVWAPYAEKSYQFYLKQYDELFDKNLSPVEKYWRKLRGRSEREEKAREEYAVERVRRECEQQQQHIEHSLNSISSARGDFAFVTFTFGHSEDRWAQLISNVILDVRRNGQGKEGAKIPVLFPKLVFLYEDKLHGPGMPLEPLFDNAIDTARVTMYPDFLSLDAGHTGGVYKKHGKIISPMGEPRAMAHLKNCEP